MNETLALVLFEKGSIISGFMHKRSMSVASIIFIYRFPLKYLLPICQSNTIYAYYAICIHSLIFAYSYVWIGFSYVYFKKKFKKLLAEVIFPKP